MATTKISALPAATTADAADLTIVVTDIGAGALQDQKATVTQAATYSRALTGATTASAIVGSGSSLIINTALADSDTRIAGTTSANLFFADAGLDKVGIATAVPTQKLDVTGTVNATLFAGSGASLTGLGATSTAFRTVATDPSPLVNGDVWYNSTSDTFKGAVAVAGGVVWTATTAYPNSTGQDEGPYCNTGTSTSALSCGGYTSSTARATVYLYNGSSWAAQTSLSTARWSAIGGGTSSAALCGGGRTTANVAIGTCELFNGSSWSSTGSLSTANFFAGHGGTSTATLVCGGASGSPTNVTQKFNGSTWSTSGTMATARQGNGFGGTSSAGLTWGGYSGGNLNSAETFNGSTWASASSVATVPAGYMTGCGVASNACVALGQASAVVNTYDGSAWSAATSLAVNANLCSATGTTTAAVVWTATSNNSYTLSTPAPTTTAKTFTVA